MILYLMSANLSIRRARFRVGCGLVRVAVRGRHVGKVLGGQIDRVGPHGRSS